MGKRVTTRSGLVLAIVALHGAALYGLLALRPSRPDTPRIEHPPLTVVILPKVQNPAAPAGNTVSAAPVLAVPSLAPPPLPVLPNIAPAAPDPAIAALGQYLGCRLQGAPQLTEDRERCAQIMRALPAGPQKDLPQTPEEKALALKFDRAQRQLESPTAIPCLMGGIQILCVAATLLTGGDWIATYSDLPQRKSDPLATGMVGTSGKTPGAP